MDRRAFVSEALKTNGVVLNSREMNRAVAPLASAASVLLLASCGVPFFGVLAALAAAQAPVSREPMATFGTTVFSSSGFRGGIYFLKPGTAKLPRLERGKPVGSVYTNVLQVPARDFREGFPGVTDGVEWFVIEYNGRFWIEQAGDYDFSLSSDDGSRMYIDGKLVINNDGLHSNRRTDRQRFAENGRASHSGQLFSGTSLRGGFDTERGPAGRGVAPVRPGQISAASGSREWI